MMPWSSPYPILGNKAIDKWEVPELIQELKSRGVSVLADKEELVRRLAQDLRAEQEESDDTVAADDDDHHHHHYYDIEVMRLGAGFDSSAESCPGFDTCRGQTTYPSPLSKPENVSPFTCLQVWSPHRTSSSLTPSLVTRFEEDAGSGRHHEPTQSWEWPRSRSRYSPFGFIKLKDSPTDEPADSSSGSVKVPEAQATNSDAPAVTAESVGPEEAKAELEALQTKLVRCLDEAFCDEQEKSEPPTPSPDSPLRSDEWFEECAGSGWYDHTTLGDPQELENVSPPRKDCLDIPSPTCSQVSFPWTSSSQTSGYGKRFGDAGSRLHDEPTQSWESIWARRRFDSSDIELKDSPAGSRLHDEPTQSWESIWGRRRFGPFDVELKDSPTEPADCKPCPNLVRRLDKDLSAEKEK